MPNAKTQKIIENFIILKFIFLKFKGIDIHYTSHLFCAKIKRMKKVLFALFIIFGVFLANTKAVLAASSCYSNIDQSATDSSVCQATFGLCIGGMGKRCCSDQTYCLNTDTGASWIPPVGTVQPPATTDTCNFQMTGDCADPSLPQACLSGMAYYCCNTRQACIDIYGGSAPVPHANPNQQPVTVTNPVACPNNPNGIETAIGCIPVLGTNGTTDFLTFILRWAVGIGGGIAFLLILYAGFMIMTSAGNPERLKAGQELLTSAISGLILLIFSVVILKFIGVDILGLAAFGFGK
jgi:hypothetical protein